MSGGGGTDRAGGGPADGSGGAGDGRWEAVLFDLDGTLIDHFRAIFLAYQHVQEHLAFPPVTLERVRRTVGGSVPVTLERLAERPVSGAELERAMALFDERFREVMYDEVEILPGVHALLDWLEAEGIRRAVLTNKRGTNARAILDHLALGPRFERTVGAEDTPYRKPQPELTAWFLGELGLDRERTLLVGDSTFDIETGQRGGLRVGAVATGSHSREELVAAGADWVAEDLAALAGMVFGGRGTGDEGRETGDEGAEDKGQGTRDRERGTGDGSRC